MNEPKLEIEAILQKICRKEGRFSTDPLTHAANCIDDMAELAEEALGLCEHLNEGMVERTVIYDEKRETWYDFEKNRVGPVGRLTVRILVPAEQGE